MSLFLQKHSLLISIILLAAVISSSLYLPAAVPTLGVFCILFAFAAGTLFIIEKYKGQEHARRKATKGILVLAITLTLAIILGGMASRFTANIAGTWVSSRWAGWGSLAALASAILASFAVGYLVRWGVGKLSRD